MNRIDGTQNPDNFISWPTSGPDMLIGTEFDILWGGAGADVFVVPNSHSDQEWTTKLFIADCALTLNGVAGQDVVDLRNTDIQDFSQLVHLYQYDADIVETVTQDDGWGWVEPMRVYLGGEVDAGGQEQIHYDVVETDFIFSTTPVFEGTAANERHVLTATEYSVSFGGGGTDTLDLRNVHLNDPLTGITLRMDADTSSSGRFTVDGVLHRFWEFRNVDGTTKADTIYGSLANNTLSGQAGNDQLFGDRGNDLLYGNVGADTLDGGYGNDKLVGGYDNDRLIGGSGNDKLYGGPGHDKLMGGGGADILFGGVGNDTLTGGHGPDVLTGGSGRDTFVFFLSDKSTSHITDFEDGVDVINLRSWGVDAFDDLTFTSGADDLLTVSYDAGNVRFTVADTLSLSAEDFIFA